MVIAAKCWCPNMVKASLSSALTLCSVQVLSSRLSLDLSTQSFAFVMQCGELHV